MNFHVLTLFPDMVMNGLATSIIGKAIEKGSISVQAVNIRDYTEDKHKKVDDYTYGGGAGLLIQAQPVFDAHKAVTEHIKAPGKVRTIYVTPQGQTFNQRLAEEFAKEEELIFLCGHYEGVDERVLEEVVTDYVSLGDFVLTGGELPAMVMIDAIARLIPGVLHNDTSAEDESFSGYLLEYPQYSRPEVWHGKEVPKVLLSGDHKKIREWRLVQSEERTKERRPDMYAGYQEIQRCREWLLKDKLQNMDMLAAIERGQAKLLYKEKEGILLKDRAGGAYMLSVRNKEAGERILEKVFGKVTDTKNAPSRFIIHQAYMNPTAEAYLGTEPAAVYKQYVYTRKEALPVSGADIRRLKEAFLPVILEQDTGVDAVTLQERMESGCVYGAFAEDALAGIIAETKAGSMGLLFVFPRYRRRGLAALLESYLINLTIQKGYTPYCQIAPENTEAIALQEKLGLYPAKQEVFIKSCCICSDNMIKY